MPEIVIENLDIDIGNKIMGLKPLAKLIGAMI
jgi:hypothetical protein